MADIQSNIRVNIETSEALASIKALQRQISAFHVAMAQGGAAANAESAKMQQNLINTLNATGNYRASIQKISSTTESFTTALEKNKLSMGEYFRYAGGASKSFGKFFQAEMQTIEKVAISRVKTLQTQYIKLGRDASGALKAIAVRPVALDMKNLGTQTAMAAQKQQLLNQLLKQGSTNLLNFGKNTQWAGRQLMVGFTIPLATLGMAATKTFRQMEEQAIKFRRVYGDTFTATEETDKMLKQIQDLATEFTKYGVAVADTMEMAAQAAASGKVGADLLAQVTSATRLAVLGNVEQQKALETTISLTDAFGTATEELGKKINFLNAVENQTVTSIEDLTTAIPKAAPVIKQLGGDVEDLAFFLTAMKEGGVNASEGANALKSGLASLINPTGKASKMLQGFGVDITKIVESNKGDVSKLVVDFAKALDTLDPLSRARAIEQMFGKFQFARMSTLFKNVIQEGSQASTVLDLMKQSSVGLAALSQKELRQIQSSPLYKFQKAIEDFKKELAPVGEEFMKAVTPLINFGRDVLANFNKLEPGMKQFIVNFTGIVAGLGPVFLMTFGLIANGVANVIKGFAFVKNTLNRVSSSSTVLGETTHFMTQEQLKAAAVAASLEQSHTKLTQAFTVERKSLELLTAAYTKATAEQARFGPTPGRRTPRKKYASGTFSVPGPKGAGDIVPAMLSPGEAVIPAKQASRYHGLIKSIIANNIPGYEDGNIQPKETLPHKKKRRKVSELGTVDEVVAAFKDKDRSAPDAINKQTQIMKYDKMDVEQSAINDEVEKIIKERRISGRAAEALRRKHQGMSAAHLGGMPGSFRDITIGGKATTQKIFTSKTVTPDLTSFNQVFADLVEKRKGEAGKKYKSGSFVGDIMSDSAQIEQLAKQVGLDPKTLTSELKKMDPTRKYGAQYPKTESAWKALSAIANATGPNDQVGRIARAGLGARITGYGGAGSREAALAAGGLKYDPSLDAEALRQQDKLRERFETKADAVSGTAQANKKASAKKREKAVSKNTESVEKNTEAINKDTKSRKKATVTDEQRRKRAADLLAKGQAEVASGKRKKLTRDQQRAENYLNYGSYNPTQAEIAAAEKKKARKPRKNKAQREQEARVTQARKNSNMRLYGHEWDPTPEEVGASRQKRKDDRRKEVRAAIKKNKPGMFSRAAGNARAAKVGKFTGGMRGVGIGSAISIGGSMLASSIPDPGIATAVGGASMVAGLLPMFPALTAGIAAFLPQIAIAGVALGGLALAFELATREERKRTKQAKDRADAVTLTTDKKQSLADFFGTSLSSKYFQPAKVDPNMTDGASQAVQELKLNEEFKSQYATTITALKEGTNEQVKVILQSLSLGLSADFAPDQIAVIVQALKEEAGKTTFKIDFAEIDVTTKTGRENAVNLVKEAGDALKTEGNVGALNMLTDQVAELKRAKDLIEGGAESVKTSTGNVVNAGNVQGLLDEKQRQLDVTSGPIGEAKIKEFASQTTNAITALRAAYDSGSISQKEFSGSVSELGEEYKKLQPYQQYMASYNWFQALPYPQDVRDSMSAIKDSSLRFDLYTLSITDATSALELFNEYQDLISGKSGIKSPDRLEAALDRIKKKIKDLIEGKDSDVIEKPLTEIQKKYEAINKLLSNYETGLAIIAEKEDKINKTYDERLDALDKVQKANEEISRQQQDQLDIADAITRGDVAGAAKAVQQARQNSAAAAFENQRAAIETARTGALSILKDPKGRTRAQLEKLINDEEMKKLLLEFWNPEGVKAATGGHIRGKGTGTSDSIPAMLSNGEYVIRAKAAKALGIDTLDKMNHAEKFAMGGPVNIAKYATGGLVGRYAKGGYASSDERRGSLKRFMSSDDRRSSLNNINRGKKESKNPVADWARENSGWAKYVPGLNGLITAVAIGDAVNTKSASTRDNKRSSLYAAGGAKGFEAGFQGMMADMGTNPFVKGFGAAITSNPYTDFIMSTLALPVNMVGSAVNSTMKNISNVGKLGSGKMDLGNFAKSSISNAGSFFADPFVSTYGHLADPQKEFKTGFQQAAQTVIDNQWFGTDTEEGKAQARIVGGFLDVFGDPTTYLGVGAVAKGVGMTGKAAVAASKAAKGIGKVTEPLKTVGGAIKSKLKPGQKVLGMRDPLDLSVATMDEQAIRFAEDFNLYYSDKISEDLKNALNEQYGGLLEPDDTQILEAYLNPRMALEKTTTAKGTANRIYPSHVERTKEIVRGRSKENDSLKSAINLSDIIESQQGFLKGDSLRLLTHRMSIANNPKHPLHSEYRDYLGLSKKEISQYNELLNSDWFRSMEDGLLEYMEESARMFQMPVGDPDIYDIVHRGIKLDPDLKAQNYANDLSRSFMQSSKTGKSIKKDDRFAAAQRMLDRNLFAESKAEVSPILKSLFESSDAAKILVGSKVPDTGILKAFMANKSSREMGPILGALGVHRSDSLISKVLPMEDIIMKHGQVFGPGVYSAISKKISQESFANFGRYEYKMAPYEELARFYKENPNIRGYIDPEKMNEELASFGLGSASRPGSGNSWMNNLDEALNGMDPKNPFIQHLIKKGYVGYAHGDAKTDWLTGKVAEFDLRQSSTMPKMADNSKYYDEFRNELISKVRSLVPFNTRKPLRFEDPRRIIKKLPTTRLAKDSGELSPIIQGLFSANRSAQASGVSSAGMASLEGSNYFLKRIADAKSKSMNYGTSGNANHPEALAETAMQEYLVSQILNRSGVEVPDLKFFPGMSSIDDGVMLGSKQMSNALSLRQYIDEHFMSGLKRNDPEQHQKLFGNLISDGIPNYANKDAVVNAIFDVMDRHYDNTLFNTVTGKIHGIDFGRLGIGQGKLDVARSSTFTDLRRNAQDTAIRMQNLILGDSAFGAPGNVDELARLGIPHEAVSVDFAPPGSVYPELGKRVADMKPTAMQIAKTLGFDLSLDALPKGFASKNKIMLDAIDAMRKSNMDKKLLSEMDPNSQQRMLEIVFENVKSIVAQKDATFKYANGGMVGHYNMGGMVKPKYFNAGGLARGADVIPAMLAPGEFVVSQPGVKNFGVDNLKAINNGTRGNDSVYNYSVNLNVNGSNANAEDIARAVSRQIDRVNSQRIRGTRV